VTDDAELVDERVHEQIELCPRRVLCPHLSTSYRNGSTKELWGDRKKGTTSRERNEEEKSSRGSGGRQRDGEEGKREEEKGTSTAQVMPRNWAQTLKMRLEVCSIPPTFTDIEFINYTTNPSIPI